MAPEGWRRRAATAASVRPAAAPTATAATAATVAVARPTTAAGKQAAAVRPAAAATAATATAEANKVVTVSKGGPQPAPTAAKGGPQPAPTAAKGGPQTTAAKGAPHPVATGAAKGGPQAAGIAAKCGQKAVEGVEGLGPLDIWTLRDHMAASQKVAKGGKRIIDIFREIDTDRSGELSRDEFSIVLKKYGFIRATDGEISAIVKLIDTDGSGSVKFSELERLIKGLGPRPPPVELEVLPSPQPPKPLRDRFPKAIGPDAAFAQPTHVQLSALAVNYWKRREHAGSRASSPCDLAHHQGSEGKDARVGSLGLVRARLGVVRANRSSSTTAEELALLLRGGESHSGHTSQISRERFVFKPSVAQGSFSPQRARDIMMTAGHVGSVSRLSGREVRPRSTSPSTTASGAQSARSTSASPPRILANDHLRDVGPDLAQLNVWKAARARSKPLALRHMQERLVQRYAVLRTLNRERIEQKVANAHLHV